MNFDDAIKENIKENMDYYMKIVKSLYDNPEIGNEEFESMKLLCRALSKYGFDVTPSYIVPTGFLGKYDSKKKGPKIAYMCEYDALPEVGHGCGHNLIAAMSLGAGVALKSIIDEIGGTVLVVGTPAEENFGGKVSMAAAGVFDDVDAAMMLHPGTSNGIGSKSQALNPLKFEFFGKNAHACEPQKGRSALDAAVLSYININLLRQFTEPYTSIHGIIRDGGEAANIIPAYASLEYYFRGAAMKYVMELSEKAEKCAEGAAMATGTEYKVSQYECPYDDTIINYALADMLKEKYEEIGFNDIKAVDEIPSGSTDVGSVSYKCPTLQGSIKIADSSVPGHSKEMAAATISKEGNKALFNGAFALASLGKDLIENPDKMKAVKDEFEKSCSI